jgi:hypothetical protein
MANAGDRLLKRQVLPPIIRMVTRLLTCRCRYRVAGAARFRRLIAAQERLVGLCFHGRQPCFSGWFTRPGFGPWTILCSRSLDGEMQHRILSGLGYRTIRGSTGRGGAQALVDLIHAQRSPEHPRIAMAVDGSRGPIERLKPGALALAQQTGAALLPMGAAASRAIVLARAWDRMHIPWPGSRVVLVLGPPLAVPPALTGTAFEAYRVGLEDLMRRLQDRAERLAGYRHA